MALCAFKCKKKIKRKMCEEDTQTSTVVNDFRFVGAEVCLLQCSPCSVDDVSRRQAGFVLAFNALQTDWWLSIYLLSKISGQCMPMECKVLDLIEMGFGHLQVHTHIHALTHLCAEWEKVMWERKRKWRWKSFSNQTSFARNDSNRMDFMNKYGVEISFCLFVARRGLLSSQRR